MRINPDILIGWNKDGVVGWSRHRKQDGGGKGNHISIILNE